MPQLLTEGIIDQLLSYYEANLPAKLSSIHLDYDDGLDLPPPPKGAYYAGERTLDDGPDYPRLFILADAMEVERYSDQFTDATHEIRIRIAASSDSTGDLRRRMYRYGRALWELLVTRFFTSSGDDYFALHGPGQIRVEYEAISIEAAMVPPPYIMAATLTAFFSKQEEV